MTVKECIELTAIQLGIAEEVKAFLSGESEVGKKNCEVLLACFNLVENELALDYLPLIAEDEMQTETGCIEYSALKHAPVRVTKVTDEWEQSIPFKIFPAYLKTQPGKARVHYTYAPESKTLEDESDFLSSARLFSYGMASEYCMATGLFEEASVWDKKYKEAIESAYRAQPCARIRSRRWA